MQIRDLIEKASKESLLEFIIAVIHSYTIMARDPDLSDNDRAKINNCIHYLAGHALALVRGEKLDGWRIDGIVEQSVRLVPSLRKNALSILKELDPGSSPG